MGKLVLCEIFDSPELRGRNAILSKVPEHKIAAFVLQNVPSEWHRYAGLLAICIFLHDWASS